MIRVGGFKVSLKKEREGKGRWYMLGRVFDRD